MYAPDRAELRPGRGHPGRDGPAKRAVFVLPDGVRAVRAVLRGAMMDDIDHEMDHARMARTIKALGFLTGAVADLFVIVEELAGGVSEERELEIRGFLGRVGKGLTHEVVKIFRGEVRDS